MQKRGLIFLRVGFFLDREDYSIYTDLCLTFYITLNTFDFLFLF